MGETTWNQSLARGTCALGRKLATVDVSSVKNQEIARLSAHDRDRAPPLHLESLASPTYIASYPESWKEDEKQNGVRMGWEKDPALRGILTIPS